MKDFKIDNIPQGKTSLYIIRYKPFDVYQYIDFLTSQEKERMTGFKAESRKQEFVATRILRHNIFGTEHIHYDQNGSPFIKNEGFISISHSKGMAAIALNKEYKVGLDLELPRENILQLAPKFLSKEETNTFDCNDPLEVTKIWSAKEALYKLAGRKKIIFAEELLLSKNNENNWIGTIHNHNHTISVKLNIFEFNHTVVSLNSEPIVKHYKHS